LYTGNGLDLSAYSRAELKGSDHRPGNFDCPSYGDVDLTSETIVYAIFRATIRIIDPVKKATLSALLLDSVTSTAPGETLDEKLAALAVDLNQFGCKMHCCSFLNLVDMIYSAATEYGRKRMVGRTR
jgi:hypothetical protein